MHLPKPRGSSASALPLEASASLVWSPRREDSAPVCEAAGAVKESLVILEDRLCLARDAKANPDAEVKYRKVETIKPTQARVVSGKSRGVERVTGNGVRDPSRRRADAQDVE